MRVLKTSKPRIESFVIPQCPLLATILLQVIHLKAKLASFSICSLPTKTSSHSSWMQLLGPLTPSHSTTTPPARERQTSRGGLHAGLPLSSVKPRKNLDVWHDHTVSSSSSSSTITCFHNHNMYITLVAELCI